MTTFIRFGWPHSYSAPTPPILLATNHPSTGYPTIHDLVGRISAMAPGSSLWKVDLEQTYCQLRSDLLNYHLMGISHRGKYFMDICPSFGCRGSSAAQQRVSNALCHLMNVCVYDMPAYVDDKFAFPVTTMDWHAPGQQG